MLYERNWDKQRVVDLFNIIDWMMRLPPALQSRLMDDVRAFEREQNMPYISSFQQLGRVEGRAEGRMQGRQEMLREMLVERFGTLSPAVEDRLRRASEAELKAWGLALLSAPTLQSVFESR
jgi:hypothetical protein